MSISISVGTMSGVAVSSSSRITEKGCSGPVRTALFAYSSTVVYGGADTVRLASATQIATMRAVTARKDASICHFTLLGSAVHLWFVHDSCTRQSS